ncbi:hypothetical protein GM418_23865 [Maribellus comscasis]|uniref:Uncharacterized protein n=1 Tax=Maribellus comscasis TaxID=2681766 RepID=A0A6I6JU11_9BACT|nr:hypothetical protein [Maribellus comscasis]QGY46585.1 hypothetical protein GM418_23865 [Maribellus comscasis]
MSNSDDFQTKLDVLKAIPNEQVQTPTLPVDVFLQEAENLYHWCLADKEKLVITGISEEQINDLPVRAGALREAQSLWFKQRYSQEEAQRDWGELSPLAYDLRDELLHVFRFAYRNDAAILNRVAEVAEGSGHADMLQDLNNLAVLGRENANALSAIGFDMTKLDKAATMADEMADLLATANGDKAEQNEAKVLRDQAYTHLKELVDEIREAGKYLFWRNATRLKGYSSKFWKRKNSRKTKNEPETETQSE